MKKKVAINASNLHLGGGVQVAVSFIEELSKLGSGHLEFHVICSSEVNKSLGANFKRIAFDSYSVIDVYGLGACFPGFSKIFKDFDAVFTVFGPDYRLVKSNIGIVGFAQPWIIYPENEVFDSMKVIEQLKTRFKFYLQTQFFKRSDRIVVELPHVKEQMIRRSILSSDRIDVVFNSVSSVYFDRERWEGVKILTEGGAFKIGFVGRDYPHKNLDIIPRIRSILKERYHIDVEFFLTLNEQEWAAKSKGFQDAVNTVGELSVSQCPSFYDQMDAVIFPSLLECFSATPLEAMIMGRPLFASDRGFVRDVCQDYAYYFDPLDPVSGAKVIADYYFGIRGLDHEVLERSKAYAESFSSAKCRAKHYISIIENELSLQQ